MIRRLLPLLLTTFVTVGAVAQTRVAILPFRNMDGHIGRNPWTTQLSDSLTKAVLAIEPTQTKFMVIPADSVEMAISELNLDPTNPQYESDIWKAVSTLGAAKVVQGNFFLQGDRVLLNVYVYDIATKMADPVNQAKNIYKSPTTFLEAIRPMAKKIHPALMQ